MIHEAFTKSEVAKRYFDLMGQNISRDQARKNFHQDKKIDRVVLKKVIDEIYKEQLKKLKA